MKGKRITANRKELGYIALMLPPPPDNIYASAFCPDRVMDSRGDFAWA